ncbi:PREDICTED: CD81 antigen [Miniopterus natalensis]|uniref:CD81 antigen n=1 Tax=Miniopterus natalensis TaxID=291302 RepID=UPI0007A6F969|nr:PREDICTED: CD81 antigen [Miniopterus natalensis]
MASLLWATVTPALFFSQLAGGVILGVALWLRHDPQTTNLLYLELGDRPAPNTFYVGIYILIAVGAVMMFVGFLGCYGAIQESQCLLGTFFTCLVILFACEVAAGIWGFVNKDQIAKDVKQFYDQALQQAVVDDDANNAKTVVKTFHETLNCCGSNTLTTLTTSILKNKLCPSGSTLLSNLQVRVRGQGLPGYSRAAEHSRAGTSGLRTQPSLCPLYQHPACQRLGIRTGTRHTGRCSEA